MRADVFSDDPAALELHGLPLLANYTSDEAFDHISEWVHECDLFHPDCKVYPTSSHLPKRVINVDTLKIHCSQAGEVEKYVALSYCWGCPMVRGALVRDNLKSLIEEGLCINSLPATVRDAIAITKRLQLTYLWIDAYCIIQDSEEDKNSELAHMAAIYGGAYITLAAASAASVEDGFLQRRENPKPKDWCTLMTLPDGSKQERVFPRLALDYCGIGTAFLACPSVHRETLPVEEPVDSRAWIYQEKTLSPRVLSFRTETLQWLCNKVDTTIYGYEMYGESRPLFLIQPTKEGGRWFTPAEMWSSVCKQYSSRKLTCAQDKLVALSAVASKFQTAVAKNRNYFAGLWGGPSGLEYGAEFLLQLSWFVPWTDTCPSTRLEPRPPGYIAPSWTWASVGSQVFFREPEYVESFDDGTANFLLEVSSCYVTPRVPDLPLGSVVDGQIRIRSRLYESKVESTCWEDGEPRSFVSLQPSARVEGEDQCFDMAVWWIFWDVKDDQPSSVLCLRITADYGLALARNTDKSNTFYRVGFLSDDGPYCFVRDGKVASLVDGERVWTELSHEVFSCQELEEIVIV